MHPRLVLILVACGLLACGPDAPRDLAVGDLPPDPTPEDEAPPTSGVVEGHVRATSGALLPEVRVTLGGLQATSDVRGWFRFEPVEPGSNLVITASRDGLSTAWREIDLAAGQLLELDLVLAAAQTESLSDAQPGPEAVIETVDGVVVEFVSGTFTDPVGAPVEGPIDIDVTLLNTPSSVAAAPGMMARGAGGQVFPLESFGMVEVVLTAGGVPVTFAGSAILSFPLVVGHPFVDGDTIGLWWFDEGQGFWVDEGDGVVDADRFVAEVTHFSWWNADRPLGETGCVTGTLETPDGEPASDFVVNAFGLDYMGSSATVADTDGAFCVPVRGGGEVVLTSVGGDGASIWTWEQDALGSAAGTACGGGCTDLGVVQLGDLTDDADGDGATELAGDCDDADPTVGPHAVDPTVDGVDADCDGIDGPDADGDHVAAATAGGTDCDDTDPDVRPGASELCNTIDDDCDGSIDEAGAQDGLPAWTDADGDGFGVLTLPAVCAFGPDEADQPGDCDDADPDVHPDAIEVCGGHDEDCDGRIDADAADALQWFLDVDGDGFGDAASPVLACLQPAGAVADSSDCAADDPAVFPGAVELCNGVDDDCDTTVDEAGSVGEFLFYGDGDGDGYGVLGVELWACLAPAGWAQVAGDCDDADPATNPGAVESCATQVDLNCDGSVQFDDADGDGSPACLDCDDGDPTVHPGATEACDLADTDCDGSLVDFFADSDTDGVPDCVDLDDDGDGDPDSSDCAPADPAVYAGAAEACDAVDSDCDGGIVDGFLDTDADDIPDCVDLDDDGDGDPDATDCAPGDPTVYANAPELCDGIDNDCDGVTDACSGANADAVVYGEGQAWNLGAALAVGDLDDDGQDDLVVASPGAGAFIGVGAVHIFSGPVGGALFPSQADMIVHGEFAEDWSGAALDASCDVNGDGAQDLVIGAWGYDAVGQATGAVYVLHGPLAPLSLLSSADAVYYGESPGDWAGWSVDCAGDTNGDGYDDVLVGAWRDDDGGIDAGAAYLIAGPVAPGTVGTLALATAKIVGEAPFDYAGISVAGAGDVSGDGFADVLVGASGRDETGSGAGAAYLVHGPITGAVTLAQADARLLGVAAGDAAGDHVAGAGDVNGDGFDDLLVGAWRADGVGVDSGALYVLHGPVTGDVGLAAADQILEGEEAGDELGSAASGAGDIDGDGFDDVVVGAPGRDLASVDVGGGYLVTGSSAGISGLAGAIAWPGETTGDGAGSCVIGGGDLDGDGIPDVILGAPYFDPGVGDAGSAYLHTGAGL